MSKVPTNYDFYLLIVPIKSLKTQNVLKSFIVGTFEYQTLEICKTDKYFSCFQLTQNTMGTLEKIFKASTEFLNSPYSFDHTKVQIYTTEWKYQYITNYTN